MFLHVVLYVRLFIVVCILLKFSWLYCCILLLPYMYCVCVLLSMCVLLSKCVYCCLCAYCCALNVGQLATRRYLEGFPTGLPDTGLSPVSISDCRAGSRLPLYACHVALPN
jgi:hypothetical protein